MSRVTPAMVKVEASSASLRAVPVLSPPIPSAPVRTGALGDVLVGIEFDAVSLGVIPNSFAADDAPVSIAAIAAACPGLLTVGKAVDVLSSTACAAPAVSACMLISAAAV